MDQIINNFQKHIQKKIRWVIAICKNIPQKIINLW